MRSRAEVHLCSRFRDKSGIYKQASKEFCCDGLCVGQYLSRQHWWRMLQPIKPKCLPTDSGLLAQKHLPGAFVGHRLGFQDKVGLVKHGLHCLKLSSITNASDNTTSLSWQIADCRTIHAVQVSMFVTAVWGKLSRRSSTGMRALTSHTQVKVKDSEVCIGSLSCLLRQHVPPMLPSEMIRRVQVDGKILPPV